jgi:hypothetical protein
VPESAALVVIDGALASTAHRRAFTRDEAGSIFRDVCSNIRDVEKCTTVGSLLEVPTPSDDAGLVDRWRLVDALLDARLLVGAPG